MDTSASFDIKFERRSANHAQITSLGA